MTTMSTPWQSCMFRWQGVANPTIAPLEHPSSASQDDDSDDMDLSAPQKSRLSAPKLQAQLSRLTDRTRLRRQKDTLFSKGGSKSQIEDLCHAQVSNKWLYHLDACAGSVLSPHDFITNVQESLGNRVWVGGGQCRCCASHLDPQVGTRRHLLHRRSHARALRVLSRRGLRHETCRSWHHHGTQRSHCLAIQAGWYPHQSCCPWTQCGLACVRGFLLCSGSSWRRCAGGTRS